MLLVLLRTGRASRPSPDAHGWQVGVSLDVSLCVSPPFCCAMTPIPLPSHLGYHYTQTKGAGTASDKGMGLSGFHYASLVNPVTRRSDIHICVQEEFLKIYVMSNTDLAFVLGVGLLERSLSCMLMR